MKITMVSNREAYGKTLVELGEQNPDVVVLEADLGRSTQTVLFGKRFPDRYFEMGIAEANMMGFAAGLASVGRIPIASTFCVFASMRAIEPIRNSIAYPRLNVKIVATNAGIEIGEDGATHQAIEDVAITRAIPNLIVVVPSDPVSTAAAVRSVVDWQGPAYVRLGRQPTPTLYPEGMQFRIGHAITTRSGCDVSLVAMGNMVWRALQAAESLAAVGVSAKVLDIFSIKPIDVESLINAADDTGCLVTAEDHNVVGGLGGAVAEVLARHRPVPVEFVGVKDCYGQSGTVEELMSAYEMTPEAIHLAALKALHRRESAAAGRRRVTLSSEGPSESFTQSDALP